ncbi:MAG TPA: hypothetical protein VK691_02440 [Solirubrobacteraceae bacterium]|jgi:hypothetical protein|nr:hypothetical protein [Solirubrobacteraceae bacterium]
MSVDTMTRLAHANPVLDPPVVESPERLRRLIEDDAPALDLGELCGGRSPIGKSSRLRRRGLIAASLCAAASVVGVVLSSGSSGPGVNVAAAAYAATSPKPGIVEAVFVTRIERGIQAGSILRQREWDDASRGLRRERVKFTEAYDGKRQTHVSESASAPGRRETWHRGRLEVSTVPRVTVYRDLNPRMAFVEGTLDGVEGIVLYRRLYREGLMRLVGRERREGQSLWKLESRPTTYNAADDRRIAIRTRLVVLVAPKTFLPIVERVIDAALPGRPTALESDLLSYRRLPSSYGHDKLFELTAQHPNARVLRGWKPSTPHAQPTRR